MASGNVHAGVGRRSEKRARWRDHLRACSASGLSAAEYCRVEGLHPKSFYRWRRVLGDAGKVTGGSGAVRQAAAVAPLFSEVQVAPVSRDGEGGVLEVVLAGARRIRVTPDFDEAALRRMVRVLEALSC